MEHTLLATTAGRQRLLNAALNIARNTPLDPQDAERALLQQFVHGTLTLDEVLARLETSGAVPVDE
jgi:hypothetical protein